MNEAEIYLRLALESDLPRLVEIARLSWLSAFAQTAPFPMLQYWFSLEREPAWYAAYWPAMTVAEVDGAVAGLVQPMKDEVSGLWVHPAYHRRGIGTALLNAAEEQIRAAGHSRIWLTCSCLNPDAMRFYEARGCVISRRYVEDFGGIDEEMEKGNDLRYSRG